MTARAGASVTTARIVVLVAALIGAGCGAEGPVAVKIAWSPVEALNAELPEAIRVYAGSDPSVPLRAWHVRVAPSSEASTRVVVASDSDGVETPTQLAARTAARVVVNGGYFRTDLATATHVGLLMVGRELLEPALDSVVRDGTRYHLARAAIGFAADGRADVAWVSSRDGVLYEWADPPPNRPDAPGEPPARDDLPEWPVHEALAGGPVLVMNGQIRVTADEEVFFGAATRADPRTAAGVTATGELILMVVDGRQRDSRGVDLLELARLMFDLGCVEALNLDGGGSSTLVVDGMLVNRPLGGGDEREIMSALVVDANLETRRP